MLCHQPTRQPVTRGVKAVDGASSRGSERRGAARRGRRGRPRRVQGRDRGRGVRHFGHEGRGIGLACGTVSSLKVEAREFKSEGLESQSRRLS